MKHINFIILITFLFFELTGNFYQWYDYSAAVDMNEIAAPIFAMHEFLTLAPIVFFVIFLCEWLLTLTTNLWHKLFAFNFGLAIFYIAIKFHYLDYISTLGIVITVLFGIIFSIFIQRKKIHHSKIFILSLIAIFFVLNTFYGNIFGLQYTVDIHFLSSIFITTFFTLTYALNWYEEKQLKNNLKKSQRNTIKR